MTPLLEIRDLTTRFFTHEGVVHAVNGISFTLDAGEIVGIVGESGSGKSVSMLSVMGLVPDPPGKITGGEVIFQKQNLLAFDEAQMQQIRGAQIAMVFQDPMTSLNPTLTIGRQIREAIRLHRGVDKRAANEIAVHFLDLVGIPDPAAHLNDYPHQFSGGMRQRAMIAMALCCTPTLLIADEPTTALDVTVQAQIVELIKRLQEKMEMAVIWITHNLGVVARLVDRVIVMYAGHIIEDARVDDLYADPRHPYTMGLLGALPRLNQAARTELYAIPGRPPNLLEVPRGCPFAPRCSFAVDRCTIENPTLTSVGEQHVAACWELERTEGWWASVR